MTTTQQQDKLSLVVRNAFIPIKQASDFLLCKTCNSLSVRMMPLEPTKQAEYFACKSCDYTCDLEKVYSTFQCIQEETEALYRVAIIVAPKLLPRTLADREDEKRELVLEIESVDYEGDTRKTCKLKHLTKAEIEDIMEYLLRRLEDELNLECIMVADLLFQN